MHLVQMSGAEGRRVAVVEGSQLRLMREVDSVLALVERSLAKERSLSDTSQSAARNGGPFLRRSL